MSSQNTSRVNTDDIERRREQWRYYARLRRQREDNESKNIRLARCRANYSRQRQQTLGSDHILVGGPANLNEEDVVHSNSTSTNPSLIPPNHTRMDEVVGLHISVTWHTICQLSIGLCKKSVVRL